MWKVVQTDHRDSDAYLKSMEDNSVDAVVCDPPYELAFMGRSWDGSGIAFSVDFWRDVLRVLKPGGHLLAFGGTRTYHRMTCAIEDAGFEIRDSVSVHWCYGSGFPKSLDASKAIDSAMGNERPDRTTTTNPCEVFSFTVRPENKGTPIAAAAAAMYDGFGTALKPSHEPIIVARKPLEGTVAANLLKHGTGAINVDACRVEYASKEDQAAAGAAAQRSLQPYLDKQDAGRWPPNLLLCHDPRCTDTCVEGCAVEEIGRQSGERPGMSGGGAHAANYQGGMFGAIDCTHNARNDTGTAARFFPTFRYQHADFFYVPKASRAEREAGCDNLPAKSRGEITGREDDAPGCDNPRSGKRAAGSIRNHHPTVKPIELMKWLVRLVTPPGGLVLDPFAGSGSTGCAAVAQGFRFLGLELLPDHVAIANARIAFWERFPGGERAAKDQVKLEQEGQMNLFGRTEET